MRGRLSGRRHGLPSARRAAGATNGALQVLRAQPDWCTVKLCSSHTASRAPAAIQAHCSSASERSSQHWRLEITNCYPSSTRAMWGKNSNWHYKGSGKSKGKGGKGKAQSWSAPTAWANAPSTDYWGGTQPQEAWSSWESDGKGKAGPCTEEGRKGGGKEYVSRLEGRYAFAKAVLRPYADERGNATYSATPGRAAFCKEAMRSLLDSKNSELCRRPPVGLTTIGSSVSALRDMLRARQQAGEADPASDEAPHGRHRRDLQGGL